MANMASYLDTKVADYVATELTITPHNMIIEEGQKRQYFHEYDSGDMEVVTTASSFFTIQIQWDWLEYSDAATILDFFHDTAKANAMKNTFYWVHPIDDNTYVVRFGTDLSLVDDVSKPNAKVIPQITLLIEGVKA